MLLERICQHTWRQAVSSQRHILQDENRTLSGWWGIPRRSAPLQGMRRPQRSSGPPELTRTRIKKEKKLHKWQLCSCYGAHIWFSWLPSLVRSLFFSICTRNYHVFLYAVEIAILFSGWNCHSFFPVSFFSQWEETKLEHCCRICVFTPFGLNFRSLSYCFGNLFPDRKT